MRAGSREEVHEIYCAPRRPQPPPVTRGSGPDLDDMTVAFLLTLYLVEEEGRRREEEEGWSWWLSQ